MVLHIGEDEVKRLLTMEDSIELMEDLFLQEARGTAENKPTTEFHLPNGRFLRIKPGAVDEANAVGLKAYGAPGRRLIFVFDQQGGLDGIVDAIHLTQVRTGAVSAVATRHMARPECDTLGIIGTGKEARTQLPAICQVRPIRKVKVYSRGAEHRETYAAEMTKLLDLDVQPVESAEECVRGMDIVVTITGASVPVLSGAWLADGTHVNAVGATTMFRRELDEEAITRAAIIIVEHMPQAEAELGELIYAAERGKLRWSMVRELRDVVSGVIPGRRSPSDITLFDSIGVGTEDIAIAAHLLRKARVEGGGTELPM